jgi:type I restriction enzyme, S subunit
MNHKEWEEFCLFDIVKILGGGTPKTKVAEYWDGNIPWLSVVDFNNDMRYVFLTEKNITEEGLNNSSAKLLDPGDTVISARGTVGAIAQLKRQMAFNQSCFGLKAREEIITKDYLYYLLKYNIRNFKLNTHGSVFDTITKSTFESINVKIPSIKKQEEITKILSYLDNKIELNNKINKTLEELAQTLYKHWFVDFEFPNEEGKPYKSSGGEMVESKLGMIPRGWKIKSLGEYFPIVTGKKNANIADTSGNYKFFTCSKEIFQTLDYSFDAEAILVAGNGDFNVKYYKGKFEAYQRTYVLVPYKPILTGLLYYSIKYNLPLITASSRGSVISFITKGSIENFHITMPDDESLNHVANMFYNFLSLTANYNSETEELTKLRDLLLPKLMSGEIEV